MKKMRDVEVVDRPREKMIARGAKVLSDEELYQVLIGSGNSQSSVREIARNVAKLVYNNQNPTLEELQKINGVSTANACKLLSVIELTKRSKQISTKITSLKDIEPLLADIRDKKQEYFVCLTLDGANNLINKHIISIGTLSSSLVHPREVFAPAIEERTASIIIAHNHPSGTLEASNADNQVTSRLREAGEILGIKLLDHILITRTDIISIL